MLTIGVWLVYLLLALVVIAGLDRLCEVRGWKGEIPGPDRDRESGEQ